MINKRIKFPALFVPIVLQLLAHSTLLADTAPSKKQGVEQAAHFVTATAYNSFANQTSDDPWVTASGERLKIGRKVIAVSRDLEAKGLRFGTEVQIEGLPGTYVVSDRTAPRWKGRIDIWMGTDLKRAKAWGKRTVKILWSRPTVMASSAVLPER